jgi:hypothetical protein
MATLTLPESPYFFLPPSELFPQWSGENRRWSPVRGYACVESLSPQTTIDDFVVQPAHGGRSAAPSCGNRRALRVRRRAGSAAEIGGARKKSLKHFPSPAVPRRERGRLITVFRGQKPAKNKQLCGEKSLPSATKTRKRVISRSDEQDVTES